MSVAQSAVCQTIGPPPTVNGAPPITGGDAGNAGYTASTPIRQQPPALHNRLNDLDTTPRSSIAGSPAPEANGTPQPGGSSTPAQVVNGVNSAFINSINDKNVAAQERDRILPILPLDTAILACIAHGARDDERKMRDFLGGIMIVGGGSLIPGFHTFLEERMRELRPGFAKDIMIGSPPRELDPQVVAWKGGSVFGKLRGTNDSWIGQMEYDRLGNRLLAYKCMWAW